MALLSAVQGVSSMGVLIVSLRNEGFPVFCLCLIMQRHLGFTEKSNVRKFLNSCGRRLSMNSSWGNDTIAFMLLSQLCAVNEKLYSRKHRPRRKNDLGSERVGLKVSGSTILVRRLHNTWMMFFCVAMRVRMYVTKKNVTLYVGV